MREIYIFIIENEKVRKVLIEHANQHMFGDTVEYDTLFDIAAKGKLSKLFEKFLIEHIDELKKMSNLLYS